MRKMGVQHARDDQRRTPCVRVPVAPLGRRGRPMLEGGQAGIAISTSVQRQGRWNPCPHHITSQNALYYLHAHLLCSSPALFLCGYCTTACMPCLLNRALINHCTSCPSSPPAHLANTLSLSLFLRPLSPLPPPYFPSPLQSNTSASPKQCWVRMFCARPSQEWARQLFSRSVVVAASPPPFQAFLLSLTLVVGPAG
jgi:hypothetical protein